jgi:hypothetical protein
MRVGGDKSLNEVRRVGKVLADTAGDRPLGERAEERDVGPKVCLEMLGTLVLAHIVQFVPALKGQQPCVVVGDHADGAPASGQVYFGYLGPGQFFGVEDHLGRSVELAGEAVTELDARSLRPRGERAYLGRRDVRKFSEAPVEIGVQEGRLGVLSTRSDRLVQDNFHFVRCRPSCRRPAGLLVP